MTITISKIVKTKPSKFGFSVMVKAEEHGDDKIFMVSTKDADSLKVGQKIEGEAELWKKTDEGAEFWSWKWPKRGGGSNEEVMAKLEVIHNFLVGIKMEVLNVKAVASGKKVSDYPENTLEAPFPEEEPGDEVISPF